VERTWPPHFAFSPSGADDEGTCATQLIVAKKTVSPIETTLVVIIHLSARIHMDLAKPAKPTRVLRCRPGNVRALRSCTFMTLARIVFRDGRF
jgi:hypothetical protein